MISLDIRRHKDYRARVLRDLDVVSFICEPLINGKDIIGTLAVADRVARPDLLAEAGVLKLLSHLLAGELERQRISAENAAILESSPAVIIEIDRFGTVRKINGMPGKATQAEVVGRSMYTFISPDDLHSVSDAVKVVFETGQTTEYEARWIGPQHRKSVYHCVIAVCQTEGSLPVTAVIIAIDVSARVEAEKRYGQLFQAMTQGVVVQDAEGWITEANPATGSIFGLPHDQLLGKRLDDPRWRLINEDEAPSDLSQLPSDIALLTEEPVAGVVFGIRRPDEDRHRWVMIASSPQFGPDETKPVGTMTVLADITERRQAEVTLLQSSRLIALGQMAAGVSHELNQPLTVIRTLTEGLQLRLATGAELHRNQVTTWSDGVLEATKRILSLSDHLRTFSREHREEHASLDVRDVVHGALAMTKAQFRSRGIKLSLDLAPNLPPVRGSLFRLEQVLVNLLRNARDAVLSEHRGSPPEATEEMRVAISVRARRDTLVLSVEDNGTGMAEHNRRQAMEPFFTTKDAEHGTGLGLSIIQKIIADHGGELGCESSLGEGTVFRVHLPIAS